MYHCNGACRRWLVFAVAIVPPVMSVDDWRTFNNIIGSIYYIINIIIFKTIYIFIFHDFRCIISQNEKKRRKPHHDCSGVFLFYGPFFVVLKFVAFYGRVAAPVVTIRAAKSLYEKTPDFSYTF